MQPSPAKSSRSDGLPTRKLLLLYGALSAVYLVYLGHALPVLDDWTILQLFRQGRSGGIASQLAFLGRLIDNCWLMAQFRVYWASFMPMFALSYAADFSIWSYFLVGWTAHLLTAVLLCRIVAMLAVSAEAGLLSGAVYAVFPASNQALLWPVNSAVYYGQALALAAWFYYTWRKLALERESRYRWTDFTLLLAVAFTGEQILPALALLLPVTYLLFGRREDRGGVLRFWLTHSAALGGLLGAYALFINRMPIRAGFELRFGGGPASGHIRWSPWPIVARLLASVGLHPSLAEWRPALRLDAVLLLLLAVALAALLWGIRRCGDGAPNRSAAIRLLLWSLAGAVLVYAPIAMLPGVEWRYLYALSTFLAPGCVAVLYLLPSRPARAGLMALALVYCISLIYFEIRQCWIPQSREAMVLLDAAAHSAPVQEGDVFVFSHAPYSIGPAPSFVAGASWSFRVALEHRTGVAHLLGAREVLVNEHGDLALYNRDSTAGFPVADVHRLRVFVRDESGGYRPRFLLALPAGGGRFSLTPLGGFARAAAPAGPLALEELRALPEFPQIYFPHPFAGALPRP